MQLLHVRGYIFLLNSKMKLKFMVRNNRESCSTDEDTGRPRAAHAQLRLSEKTEYLWIQRAGRVFIGASGCVSCVMFQGRCLRAVIRVLRAACGSTSCSGAVRVRSVLINNGPRTPLRIHTFRILSGISLGSFDWFKSGDFFNLKKQNKTNKNKQLNKFF